MSKVVFRFSCTRGLACALLVSVALAGVGCGDDNAPVDLGADLSASGTPCNTIAVCISVAAGNLTLIQDCIAKGSPHGKTLYSTLQTCAYGQCTMTADGGQPSCTSSMDTSASCVTCVQAQAQGAACAAPLAACLNDK
jgi:hypothetical protein